MRDKLRVDKYLLSLAEPYYDPDLWHHLYETLAAVNDNGGEDDDDVGTQQ